MIIISGSNTDRFKTYVNHKNYADYRGYDYKYFTDIDYEQGLMTSPAYTKVYAVLKALESHNEVMWIDDDAFFINFEWDCKSVFTLTNKPFIASQSHSIKRNTPALNSGVMFFRRNKHIKRMLKLIPNISDEEKTSVWQKSWGSSGGNDQPRFIYLSQTKFKDVCHIIPYAENRWNTRPRHALKSTQHIVHFAGDKKQEKIDHFQETANISLYSKCIISPLEGQYIQGEV